MSLRMSFVFITIITVPIIWNFDALSQEGVTSVVTPSGGIVYYSTDTPTMANIEKQNIWAMSKIAKDSSEIEAAVDQNVKLQDFFTDNPDFYVTTGYLDPLYTWDPKTKNIIAAPFQAGADLETMVSWGARLDTNTFLASLANDLLNQTQKMACQISVRPTTVEGTVSVGVVSFSANWDLGKLCEE